MNERTTGYQPTNTLDGIVPPKEGPAYKPKMATVEEAVQKLVDTNAMMLGTIEKLNTVNMMMLSDIEFLKKRVRNVEADLRQALEKVSIMERMVSNLRADMPEGSVTDDDQPEIFDWEGEE